MNAIVRYLFFGAFFLAGIGAFVGSAYEPFTFWLENGYWNKPPSQIIFGCLFLLTHGGIGFGGLVYTYFNSSDKKNLENSDPYSPWLGKPRWSNSTIESDTGNTARVVSKVAVYFSLVSVVVVFSIYESLKREEYEAVWGVIIPIIALVLFYWSKKLKYRLAKYGTMPLRLDPYPASIGGQFGGEINITGLKYRPQKAAVTVACVRHYRSGKNTRQSVLWQETMSPAWKRTMNGFAMQFCFDLPDQDGSQVAQSKDSMPYVKWHVVSDIVLQDDTKIKRKHSDIPVFRTAKKSSIHNPQAFASQSLETQSKRIEVLDKIMSFEKLGPKEYGVYYPAGRNLWGYLTVTIGIVFIVAGIAISDLMFNILFPLIGGLAFFAGVYQVANSLRVNISANGIYTDRFIFGIKAKRQVLALGDLIEFKPKRTHSTQSTSSTTEYFNVLAIGSKGESFVVVDNLSGRGQANAAIARLNSLVNSLELSN